jgi:PAS domain S-box-containing protein
LFDDPDEIKRLLVQRAANTERISELIRAIEPRLETEEEKRLLAAVEATRKPYVESYMQALAKLLDEHQRDEARKMMVGVTLPRIAVYHDAWNAFTRCQVDEIEQAIKQSKADFAAAQRRLLFLIILAGLITVAIAVYVTFRVTQEIADRQRAEEALRQSYDQLEQRIQERTTELAQTNQALQAEIIERQRVETASIRLAAIIESSDDAIISKDLNSIITSWNKGAERIFGYAASDMVGTSIMRLIPADRRDEENHLQEKIKCGESVDHFETLRQTKDGRLINVSATASPIKDATGKVIGVSTMARRHHGAQARGKGATGTSEVGGAGSGCRHGAHTGRDVCGDASAVQRGDRATSGRGVRAHLDAERTREDAGVAGQRRQVHAPQRTAWTRARR